MDSAIEKQVDLITRLSRCSFLPGSFDKRIVRQWAAHPEKPMTPKGAAYLAKLAHKYRRQLGSKV